MTGNNDTTVNPIKVDDPPKYSKEGLAVLTNMKDLKSYWYVCIKTKGIPNAIRYTDMEDINRNLADAFAHAYRANEHGGENLLRKQNGLPPRFKPYDILQDARKAEDFFTIAKAKIKLVTLLPELKQRKGELNIRVGKVSKTMRGWLIYLQSQSR